MCMTGSQFCLHHARSEDLRPVCVGYWWGKCVCVCVCVWAREEVVEYAGSERPKLKESSKGTHVIMTPGHESWRGFRKRSRSSDLPDIVRLARDNPRCRQVREKDESSVYGLLGDELNSGTPRQGSRYCIAIKLDRYLEAQTWSTIIGMRWRRVSELSTGPRKVFLRFCKDDWGPGFARHRLCFFHTGATNSASLKKNRDRPTV